MTFEVHQYPYHRVVYRISEGADIVYIGEGLATRLGTTLTDPRIDPLTKKPQKDPVTGDTIKKYSVLTYDTCGNSTGTAELRYVNVDAVVAQALQVPDEMRPGQKRETLISTNVENILIALFAWQTGQLPRENGIQNDGNNKGGWIADCRDTLSNYFDLYETMNCPVRKPWPCVAEDLPQKNPDPRTRAQFLAVWSSIDTTAAPPVFKLNIGFCKVDGDVPHMSADMSPDVRYSF